MYKLYSLKKSTDKKQQQKNKFILFCLKRIYTIFLSTTSKICQYPMVFYRQKEWNNNLTPKHISKDANNCIHELYR